MSKITGLSVSDVRFPTSRRLDGSDAMNPDPDYSAAYVVMHTDADDGLEGHGFTFTIGRGNEVCCAAIEALAPLVVGRNTSELFSDMGAFWRLLTRGDSQLRWLGPEKGVIHLATAAVVNAAWDLYAKREGKPLWKLLAGMPADELVCLVDFSYISDALSRDEALDLLRAREPTKAQREDHVRSSGIPAYTTSAGWLGYDDEKLRQLCRSAVDEGWSHVKLKVGANIDDDTRRCAIAREELGPSRHLMVDANQCWDVKAAISNVSRLAEFDLWWVEEPTIPDDILGHRKIAQRIAPVQIATGEQVHNRVMFKQLLQAEAIGFCQVDACRLAGVNEVIAVQLLAAKFGVPVCPHAGGVGLPELVQHLSTFDYVAVSGRPENIVVEYVDHLHEHFLDPVTIKSGRYVIPGKPGYSAEMYTDSIIRYRFPDGPEWRSDGGAPLRRR
jgi:L-fuconate dehydratase